MVKSRHERTRVSAPVSMCAVFRHMRVRGSRTCLFPNPVRSSKNLVFAVDSGTNSCSFISGKSNTSSKETKLPMGTQESDYTPAVTYIFWRVRLYILKHFILLHMSPIEPINNIFKKNQCSEPTFGWSITMDWCFWSVTRAIRTTTRDYFWFGRTNYYLWHETKANSNITSKRSRVWFLYGLFWK